MNNEVMEKTIALFTQLTGKTFTAIEVLHLGTLHQMVWVTDNVDVATKCLTTGSSVPAVKHLLDQAMPVDKQDYASVKAEAEPVEKMPAIELLETHLTSGKEPLKYPEDVELPSVMRTFEPFWQDGYRYKINVLTRDLNRRDENYTMHYLSRPTKEEFAEHFQLYIDGTHYVHVMESDGINKSWPITPEYTPLVDASGRAIREKPVETFNTTSEWPDDKNWRIRFHDQRTGLLNYVYFASKPSGIQLAKYHSAKGFAVSEAKPKP